MARATLNMSLSPYGISDIINRLEYFKSNIDVACEEIVSDIVDKGLQIAVENDNYSPFAGNGDYNFVANSDGKKGYIAMEGEDSVYVEFGTGDVGEDNPHPLHQKVDGLNPYNSGVTIRLDENGRHWWIAPVTFTNQYYMENGFTRGIPAGAQMYNTLIELQDIIPDVAKKHLENAMKKL